MCKRIGASLEREELGGYLKKSIRTRFSLLRQKMLNWCNIASVKEKEHLSWYTNKGRTRIDPIYRTRDVEKELLILGNYKRGRVG